MSAEGRRRKPGRRLPRFQSGPNRLFVVCTDRGQHQEVRLTTVVDYDEGISMPGQGGPTRTGYAYPRPDAEPARPGEVGMSRNSYVFWCRVCGRHPQLLPDKWLEVVAQFRRAGLRRIDVSLLPF